LSRDLSTQKVEAAATAAMESTADQKGLAPPFRVKWNKCKGVGT